MSQKKKILIIGLDCATPEILFDKRDMFPNINMLISNGISGKLRSCHPPITIPAWMVMGTGVSPGKLGLYGFRHRKGYSYNDMWIATSYSIKQPAIWDIIGDAGLRSCLVAVPPTYPVKQINGWLVSCFITPDTEKQYTYPAELKKEIEDVVGKYIIDVEFRTDEKDKLLKDTYEMTEKRFEVIKYLMREKMWDLFFFVEIGMDRIQHGFWKFYDKSHHMYEPNNKYESVILDYYEYIDKKTGELLELIDDNTIVLIVSDHGAKPMKGAFCVNEWLIQEGYLSIKDKQVEVGVNLDKVTIDWHNTKAWGWGGYYARIFFNVEGRESEGVIKSYEFDKERDMLIEKLKDIRGPKGEKWNTIVYRPEDIYDEYIGDAPDLMVYFDELYWRSAGTIGYRDIYLLENDTGPDDAVHSQDGLYVLYDPEVQCNNVVIDADILDIAPTILSLLKFDIPKYMKGQVIGENN
jgi:predicted AlkP superfamily phosphohydrolase/phosphomutase